jgi:hypothetical protein
MECSVLLFQRFHRSPHSRPGSATPAYDRHFRPSSVTSKVARRTAKSSFPEKTSHIDLPSLLIHLGGKLLVSPGPTSHFSVKKTVLHGPHGAGAS